MKKVLLLNNQGGSYGLPLSYEAIVMIEQLTGIRLPIPEVYIDEVVRRDCPALFEVIDKLGSDAFRNDVHETEWKIVEVPDDMQWGIAFRDNGDEILYDTATAIMPVFKRNYNFD